MKDLEAEAKKDPENFTWTSLGGTSSLDVTALQFFKAIGVDASKTRPIISTGGSVAVIQTAGGHVKMGVGTPSGALPSINSDMVRALGITSSKRFSQLPDLPTTRELGYPSIDCIFWVGVSGPPGLPAHIVDVWTEALQEMSRDPKYIQLMTRIGTTVNYLGPQELKDFISREVEDLRSLGLKKKK